MPYTPPPNAPKGIVVANRFMTCILEFVPRNNERVDHFHVINLTWHNAATPEYRNISNDRRVRADINARHDSPGLTASQDVNLRIAQIPLAQRTSTRIYENDF